MTVVMKQIVVVFAILISVISCEKAKPAQVVESDNVIINVYGRPEAVSMLSSAAFNDAFNQLRERLKTMSANMPKLPAMPTMPTFSMPSMPTYPSQIRVPVRVQVTGQEYKFPPPPALPSVTIPEKFVVHRVELPTPTLSLPSAPVVRPIQVEYQDFKPSGPLFQPGTVLLQPVRLEPVSGSKKKN